ncbi:hypothetical protein J2Z32_004440 [Paenibacillus turicensis]|uniref:GT-D fold-like domain-containing protein n=1 Tax=Paenibacillus turicensis TaxID=160487 RepID=A0ABS4FYV0_9BACL|nr:GT-D fold domain-containing glycosyltransferase [Paenibacillus turicensis]MBP1907759.1 hypothetical protein [Paenibacillus turicensis]
MVRRSKKKFQQRKTRLTHKSRRVFKKNKRGRSAPVTSKQTITTLPTIPTVIDSTEQRPLTESSINEVNQEPSLQLEQMNAELNEIYAKAYEEGYFEGGEAKVGNLIPQGYILPEYTVDHLLAIAFQTVRSSLVPLNSPTHVYHQIKSAIEQRQPFSLVRLGDGELLTLAHNTVISTDEAKRRGAFLPYAGVQLPDAEASAMLIEAIKRADYIGIPESRHPSYQGLLFPVLKHAQIDYRKLKLTSSTINYALNEQGFLHPILSSCSLLLIGNQVEGLSHILARQGYRIAGMITPVNGTQDVASIVEQASHFEFDLAFVSAGVAAVAICTGIVSKMGKVALDMGHMANKLESGEIALKFRLGV